MVEPRYSERSHWCIPWSQGCYWWRVGHSERTPGPATASPFGLVRRRRPGGAGYESESSILWRGAPWAHSLALSGLTASRSLGTGFSGVWLGQRCGSLAPLRWTVQASCWREGPGKTRGARQEDGRVSGLTGPCGNCPTLLWRGAAAPARCALAICRLPNGKRAEALAPTRGQE